MNKKTPYNSTYPKVAVQLLNQALCIYQILCLADSEVLRNRHLRVAAKRYSQLKQTPMRKTILFATLILVSFASFAQSSLSMDNTTKYGSTIIKPTWNNLSSLLTCDMSTFKATMKKYSYSLATDGSSYIADTQVGSPYFTIQKSNDDIMMVFTKDDGFASSFRAEIKKLLGGGTVKYESGYEIYYASFESGGYKYNIKIAIKENMNGSSTVGIIKI